MFSPLIMSIDPGGIWGIGVFGVVLIFTLLVCIRIPNLPLPGRLLLFYVLTYSQIICIYPKDYFSIFNKAFMTTAAQVFIQTLAIAAIPALTPKRVKPLLLMPLFTVIFFYELVCIWSGSFGLMAAQSFDLGLLALFFPFVGWSGKLLIGLTCVTHHGSTAILMVLAQLLILCMADKRLRVVFLVAIPIMLASVFYHRAEINPLEYFGGQGRVTEYTWAMRWWTAQNWKVLLFGTGPGSFIWLSYVHKPDVWFFNMHNDWLQTLFELGVVGVGLLVAFFVTLVKQSRGPRHLASLFAMSIFCGFYHPFRFAPTALFMAFVVDAIIQPQRKKNGIH